MKKIRMKKIAAIALTASLLAVTQAAAQETAKVLGTFKDWEVHSFQEGGAKVCNMFSRPTESEGNYTERGDVYMFVTNRPAEGVADEFSVQIGYSLQNRGAGIRDYRQQEIRTLHPERFRLAA